MKVLVTGADGFIGKRLVRKLRLDGQTVITHCLDNGEITDFCLNDISVDWVVHLAARTYVPQSWEEPYEFYRVNVLGTANILEYCRRTGSGITFLSTYVYGLPEKVPISENHPIAPNTPYNHSKVLAESLVEFYNNKFQIDCVILRPFNIYGAGQNNQFLIPLILQQLIDETIEKVIVQDLSPRRDYLYIDDLIDAIVLTIERKGFAIYNIGSGLSYSVEEIIKIAMKASAINKPYCEIGQRRQGEIDDLFADITLIKKDLNWRPKVNFHDGIIKMINNQ